MSRQYDAPIVGWSSPQGGTAVLRPPPYTWPGLFLSLQELFNDCNSGFYFLSGKVVFGHILPDGILPFG